MGKATIDEVYCWELQKIAKANQIRAAFFSSENRYKKFHFFCFGCGIPMSGKNVMTHRNLNKSKHKTPHFSKWPKEEIQHHRKCPFNESEPNKSSGGSGTGGSTSTSESEEFYYKHFLLEPMNFGIVENISHEPNKLSQDELKKAVKAETEYTLEQTSNFKDIVDCFNELKIEDKLDQVKLKINDSFADTTTYAKIFRHITEVMDFYTRGENMVKYKIHYGGILNNYINKEAYDGYWSFYIEIGNDQKVIIDNKIVLFEVLLPISLLNTNTNMKRYIDKEVEAGKILKECFLANTKPEAMQEVPNKKNPEKSHYVVKFIVNNFDHFVLIFKEKGSK